MTLKAYTATDLDGFALRLLDLAGMVREMSRKARESAVDAIPLNDKKALEWCGRLEQWAIRAQADLDSKIHITRAVRRAQVASQ
jgi:hypothetical protein